MMLTILLYVTEPSVMTSATFLILLASPQKVTITTVHGAKGLEWPVVFLPCRQYSNRYRSNIVSGYLHTCIVEDGTYPFYRSTEEDEIREERFVTDDGMSFFGFRS